MVPGSAAYPILPVTQAITAYKIAVLATSPSSKKAKLKTIESIPKPSINHTNTVLQGKASMAMYTPARDSPGLAIRGRVQAARPVAR